MSDRLFTVKDLKVSFPQRDALNTVVDKVSFTIDKNQIVAIVGESGSGKSVTSRAIMGLLPPHAVVTAQQCLLEDLKLLELQDGEWSRLRGSIISMIFQEPMSSLNPSKTCGHQVAEILSIHEKSLTIKQIKAEVLSLFEKVKLPDPGVVFNKYPHEISGGQMQRVMIAMAIACRPKLLIADEPTTALDVTVQQDILLLLHDIQQEYGMSILFISHDLALVKSIAHRVIVMYNGKIVEQDTVNQIFTNAQHEYTRALIAARPDPEQRLLRLPTITKMLSQDFKPQLVTPEERLEEHKELYSKKPLIEVTDLSKKYELRTGLFSKKEYFTAVDKVSFTIYPGESLGLVGESGCGKSTLGNLLLGLKESSGGSILYKDKDLIKLNAGEWRGLRKELQIIFQDPFASLNPKITVGKAILEPMIIHNIGDNATDRKQRVIKLLERVGLDAAHYNRYPHEFSGGQRQRIGIARSIAVHPQFIVCDESVSALDISVQAQVLNLLNDLKNEFGFSYLFISHDLSVVRYFCDRVIVMNKGKIEEIQEADTLYHHPKTAYTKKLIAAAVE